jgi:release factor glutamine methyltransferase
MKRFSFWLNMAKHLNIGEDSLGQGDSFSPARAIFRRLVHHFAYHFVLRRKRSTKTRVASFELVVLPTVFHPKVFLTSAFFAKFVQALDLRGKSVIEIGAGSGILSLSAAKAGAISVTALDINPAAVEATKVNAAKNGFHQVQAFQSDLFSAISIETQFDIVIASPPSFSGEPRDTADRAWHAGPGYRDILALFEQAAPRLRPCGRMYLLLSSDTNLALMNDLIRSAGLSSTQVAKRSIWIETFYLYELSQTQAPESPSPELYDPCPTAVQPSPMNR